jgi:enterochelin esterase-like enzyme
MVGSQNVQPRQWREVVESASIARLEANMRAGLTSPPAFWSEIARVGTPLVEPVQGDAEACDVTFVLRAEPGRGAWTLCEGISPPASARFRLSNVPGSDVWHVSVRMPRDSRVTYGFSPDVNPGGPGFDWEAHFARRRPDPYNRLTVAYPDQGILSPWGRTVSLLDLDGAEPRDATSRDSPRRHVPDQAPPSRGALKRREIHSPALGRQVPVYVYVPPGYGSDGQQLGPRRPLAVLFDGWELVEIGHIAAVFDELIDAGRVPPFVAVMPDPREHRAEDLYFSDPHYRFVTGELIDWAREQFHVSREPSRTVIGGASLGGLTALSCAFRRPDLFGNAISLIGAVGAGQDSEPDWLANRFTESPKLPLRIHLEAGLLDNDDFPGGLPAMLDANRRLRRVLQSRGYDLEYGEFPGGHDWVWLPDGIARGLAWLLTPPDVITGAEKSQLGCETSRVSN